MLSDAPLLEVRALGRRFGGVQAVADCSLTLRAGRITGLIGPNGAGKTTLFNLIAGALRPTAGQILYAGRDIAGLSPERLFHAGILRTFQIPHLFRQMTLLENLMVVPPGQRGERPWRACVGWGALRRDEAALRARALEVLEFLELAPLAGRLAGQLSGGQMKLLEIGRAMMARPRLLLLDEPGAGVSRALLGKVAETIRRLHREQGYTVCVIEHDMDLVAELCDPVVCMAEGRVVAEGTLAALRADLRVREAYFGAAA